MRRLSDERRPRLLAHHVALDVGDMLAMQFVKINGEGDPNRDPAYQRTIERLYSLSYAMKFASKTASGKDYVVPPLERFCRTAEAIGRRAMPADAACRQL